MKIVQIVLRWNEIDFFFSRCVFDLFAFDPSHFYPPPVYIVISTVSIQLLAALLLLVPRLYQWMMLCFVSLCENVQTIFIILHTHLHRHSALRRHRRKIVERTQQTNRRKMFPCCVRVWWNPRTDWKPEAKHTQTPKNCFRLFSSIVIVYCLLSLGMCAGTRGNDDSSEWRGWWKKYHCLIVLLLISLPFINHYRFRFYVHIDVQINFVCERC